MWKNELLQYLLQLVWMIAEKEHLKCCRDAKLRRNNLSIYLYIIIICSTCPPSQFISSLSLLLSLPVFALTIYIFLPKKILFFNVSSSSGPGLQDDRWLYDYNRVIFCCQPCLADRWLHIPEVNGQIQHWDDAKFSFLYMSNLSLELISNVSRTHSPSKAAAFLELPTFTGSRTIRTLPSGNLFRWC